MVAALRSTCHTHRLLGGCAAPSVGWHPAPRVRCVSADDAWSPAQLEFTSPSGQKVKSVDRLIAYMESQQARQFGAPLRSAASA